MRRRPGLIAAGAFALLAAVLTATVTLAAPGLLPAARGATELPVHAVCYGPHRDGQRPDGPAPSTAELREDLHLLAAHWNLVRVYGSRGPAETMLAIIRADSLDLKVMLGAWVSPADTAGNRAEIEAAARLAAAYPELVAAVCVGNETQVTWSAHRCAPEVLLAALRETRTRVQVPVTTADDFNFWNKPESAAVAAEVDFITLHAHPLWNGRQLEEALPWLRAQLDEVAALHPDRTVVIGETGWATQRHTEGEQATLMKGRLGEAQQKIFHDEVRAWAAEARVTVFFFEAFDENWKGGAHPDEVEKHWGLWRADRTPKAALAPAD
ncbi:MAG: glycosyl hydrolase family 17 [bacterium]|nr:glycosyl hydrolase family 17 [bacterium]